MQDQQRCQPPVRLQSAASSPFAPTLASHLSHKAAQHGLQPQPCKARDWDCPGDCKCPAKQVPPPTDQSKQSGAPATTDVQGRQTKATPSADMATGASAASKASHHGSVPSSGTSIPSQMAVDAQKGPPHTEHGADGCVAYQNPGETANEPAYAPQAAKVCESVQVRSHLSLNSGALVPTFVDPATMRLLQIRCQSSRLWL